MLNNGNFLLRTLNVVQQGDATLQLKPLLRFPGPLLGMEMDPTQEYLVTNSLEPAAAARQPGDVPSPATAAAGMVVDGQASSGQADTVVRILRRESGQVMLVSRARAAVHLPINSSGYVETLRGSGAHWTLALDRFTGGSTILGRLNSWCSPAIDSISPHVVAANTCEPDGRRKLVVMTTDGRMLWENTAAASSTWPILLRSPDGSRLARETLIVDRPAGVRSPIYAEEIKGQLIEVFDAANGNLALSAWADPVLDGGGNLAISPSGRRVAILDAGAIQVFELAAPPQLAGSAPKPSNP
jgi:hypothetical protein